MWFHLRRKTTGRLALELWPEIRRTVLVAGSGRSGTTWLAQMLNYDNRFRVLFEPFRPDGGHGVPALPAYIYLRKNEENSEVFKLVSNILLGRIHSPWIDQYNVRFFSLRRLVKDIHLNLLLGWMQNKFPDLKIVWILRHPFAVALSKTIAHQKNGSWAPAIHRFLENDAFRDGVLQPFLSELTDFPKMDIWGQHVWRWSIENYVPLVQLKKDKICTVHYEHLCQNPNKELTRIFDYLDMTIPKGIEKVLIGHHL